MEYKIEDKERKQEDDWAEKSPSLPSGAPRPAQKTLNSSKKETIRAKKNMKKETNGQKNPQLPNNENQLTHSIAEEDSSPVIGGLRLKKQKIMCSISELTTPYSLDKLILKPPYISITKGNRIIGDYGHSTAIFKRPVIEGQVYMEFLIKQDAKKDKKTTYSSAVRVGLCTNTFNPSFPLGYGESISYKSSDGSIISKRERIDSGSRYGVGDVIGICLDMSPPNKIPNPEQISEGSSVTFYKNGQAVKTFKSLKQLFYCFAVSLYNYSQVEVVGGPQSVHKMPKQAKHYFTILGEKIPYKDLQSKRMFKL